MEPLLDQDQDENQIASTIEADRDGREEGEDLIRRASQRSRLSTPSPEYDVVVVVKLAEKFV